MGCMDDASAGAGAPPATRRTTIDALLQAARAGIRRYTPAEALAAQARGALLVDKRAADALRAEGTVPGALHLPLSVLPWRADPDSAWHDERIVTAGLDAELILLCADDYSSSLAARLLRELDFARAGDVDGGFAAWAAAGLPVVPPILSP